MSGETDLTGIFIVLISAIAVLTDATRGKIHNWLTLPAIVGGLAFSAVTGGLSGLAQSGAGVLIGLFLFGGLFVARILGGGDVKLLMALGAFGGSRFTLEVALLSVLLGGVMAAIWLALKGKLPDFVRRFQRFVLTLVVKELEAEKMRIDRSTRMPYGLAIGGAAIWAYYGEPFRALGVRLW